LLPAFIVAGLREIGEPSRKALIVDLASETQRGQAVGLYYLLRGVAIFPGAFLGGLLWQVRPSLPFWAGFVLIAAGLVFFVGWGPGRNRER
jgi:predicted MFS family arabinose efflux permease